MNHAIILAAGTSERFNKGRKKTEDKLLVEVKGRPIIYYAISSLNDHHLVDSIILVVSKDNKKEIQAIVKKYNFLKVKEVVEGGKTRQESLAKGIRGFKKPEPGPQDLVTVHNGANPLPSYEEITDAIVAAEEKGAAIVGHKIKSTIKQIKGKKVEGTIDRKTLFEAQTPQIAQYGILIKALKNAEKKKLEVTDEAMLLEEIGQEVEVVPAHENNIKVTSLKDIEVVRVALGEMPGNFFVGIGQDSHLFCKEEYGLTLAGVLFKDQKKLEANSDGDVILHALFNSISQAIGEQSIGVYADEMCIKKGIKDSSKYLEPLLEKLETKKLKIHNLGVMIECKIPKIDKITPLLKKSLAKILKIDAKRIGITATSGENATAFGEGLGIQCFCIVSLSK